MINSGNTLTLKSDTHMHNAHSTLTMHTKNKYEPKRANNHVHTHTNAHLRMDPRGSAIEAITSQIRRKHEINKFRFSLCNESNKMKYMSNFFSLNAQLFLPRKEKLNASQNELVLCAYFKISFHFW